MPNIKQCHVASGPRSGYSWSLAWIRFLCLLSFLRPCAPCRVMLSHNFHPQGPGSLLSFLPFPIDVLDDPFVPALALPSQSAQSHMHELAKTLPPPRKQNTACDACRFAALPSFFTPLTASLQLPEHERSSAIESPATIELVVDFCFHPSHTQLPTQVPGRLPARSFFCDSLVNPRSVHQHCLSKDYPCTSVFSLTTSLVETSPTSLPRNFVQQETAKKRHRKPRSQNGSTIG